MAVLSLAGARILDLRIVMPAIRTTHKKILFIDGKARAECQRFLSDRMFRGAIVLWVFGKSFKKFANERAHLCHFGAPKAAGRAGGGAEAQT